MSTLIVLLLTLSTAAAFAAETTCGEPFEPAPGSYEFVEEERATIEVNEDLRISRIYYTRLPVFDETNPRENNAVYRFGNRFHILTRERTVARDVLFEAGDEYDSREIAESARLLRRRDHLYDADIRPVATCNGKVDVEVITRDVWSFNPEVSFDRTGGENSVSFGIAETNLLGLGREISFMTEDDIDRRSTRFSYEDANIGGSRLRTKLEYTDSSDGFQRYAFLSLPFYSLDSRHSWEVIYDEVRRDDEQFFRGEAVTEVQNEIEEFQAAFGFSKGIVDGVTRRFKAGFVYRDDRFTPAGELPPPTPFPESRVLSYPYVQYSMIEDDFTTAFNLDEIHRTEDLHLGRSLSATLGIAATAFGSDENRLVTRLGYRDTLLFNDRHLLQHSASLNGFYNVDDGEEEDVIIDYRMRYFRSRNTHRAFFATFEATWTRNLNTNRQVVMGGLGGVRAYDNRFQVGDRRVHVTFEERQYTDLHILNLVRVGYAAFLDLGRAWESGVDDGLEDDWLANVGLGIRLASSKANVGRIVHIDVAFPLTNRDDPAVDSVQIAVNIKNSF